MKRQLMSHPTLHNQNLAIHLCQRVHP
jgi:hypothetical protein